MRLIMLIFAVTLCFTNGYEIKEKDISEARGKGKYALLTNLAILLAVKVGLYKIFLGISFLIAAIKAMVVMAWSLAVFRYVPNTWTQKTDLPHHEKPPSNVFLDVILNNINLHFFYVAASKLFVLKIIYGAIFYVIVYKAWHLVLWLIKYMKENKHDHYVEFDHAPVYEHDHGHGHDYYSHGHDYHNYDHGHDFYSPDFSSPYGAYEKPVYGRKEYSHKKKVYDADGSYSVQN